MWRQWWKKQWKCGEEGKQQKCGGGGGGKTIEM